MVILYTIFLYFLINYTCALISITYILLTKKFKTTYIKTQHTSKIPLVAERFAVQLQTREAKIVTSMRILHNLDNSKHPKALSLASSFPKHVVNCILVDAPCRCATFLLKCLSFFFHHLVEVVVFWVMDSLIDNIPVLSIGTRFEHPV